MVREARYAWDDEENDPTHHRGLPERRDRFDDLDDDLLDPFLPKAKPRRKQRPGAGPDEQTEETRPAPKSERRHLADADWLRET